MSYLIIFNFLVFICLHNVLFGTPSYTISEFDIQSLEQKIEKNIVHSYACEINNLGQVVGLCNVQENHWSEQSCAVYIWDQDIGFEVISLDDNHKRFPVINDNGIVAWTTYQKPSTSNGETLCFGYLWDTKSKQVQSLGNNHLMINAINNRNEVLISPRHSELATFLLQVDPTKAPVISRQIWGDVGNFSRSLIPGSFAERQSSKMLNNISQVVGRVFFRNHPNGSPTSHGFLWSHSGIEDIGSEMDPYGINDEGKIVGCSHSAEPKICAVLWQEGEMIIIQQNARACAINNHGYIVGDMGFGDEEKAFVHIEGVTYELFNLIIDKTEWTSLKMALDINDAGQIVGYGLRNGKVTGFLLNPF